MLKNENVQNSTESNIRKRSTSVCLETVGSTNFIIPREVSELPKISVGKIQVRTFWKQFYSRGNQSTKLNCHRRFQRSKMTLEIYYIYYQPCELQNYKKTESIRYNKKLGKIIGIFCGIFVTLRIIINNSFWKIYVRFP